MKVRVQITFAVLLFGVSTVSVLSGESTVSINFPKIRNVRKAKSKYDGKKIKIMGWMVAVDAATDVKYFLLVSNSRFCVHVPPPPINQIVFVEVKDTAKLVSGEPVYVVGDLNISPQKHEVFGNTIYRLYADSVIPVY